MIYFTSDTHFNHANIMHLGTGRPFDDIGHHDEMIILNWNREVKPSDMVIHLGDVSMGPWPVGLTKVGRLNGFKVLIPGNHDRVSSLESQSRRDRFKDDYLEVFDEVWNEVEQFSLSNEQFILSHYPYTGDHTPVDRHAKLRPVDTGVPLIHGHTHSNEKIAFSKTGTPMLQAGVDANNFTPVGEDIILKRLQISRGSKNGR